MNTGLPETVDAWRMVQARRSFQGVLPLAALPRLRGSLAATAGEVAFELDFGTDDLSVAYVAVRANTALPLICQRTLELFALPVKVDTRLGLIVRETDEAGLPGCYEPLLLAADGVMRPVDVIEDELILALPLVPVKPGAGHMQQVWGEETAADEADEPNPFAVLETMKAKKTKASKS